MTICWKGGGEEFQLGVVALNLWREIERSVKSHQNPVQGDFPHLLERGARNLALRALSKRNRSKQWIRHMLVESGVPGDLADRIGHEMAQRGYIDEHALRDRILEEAERRGRGNLWVRQQVAKHRLSEKSSKELIQASLAGEVPAIVKWLQLQGPTFDQWGDVPLAQIAKLSQKLARRGFGSQSIARAFDHCRSQGL